ncbi:MAG: hypothetical protein V4540_17315 [Pseudomonadota bacterium]
MVKLSRTSLAFSFGGLAGAVAFGAGAGAGDFTAAGFAGAGTGFFAAGRATAFGAGLAGAFAEARGLETEVRLAIERLLVLV